MAKEEIKKFTLSFLKSQKGAAVATASKAGEPQVATLYYVIDDDFTFFLLPRK